MSIVSVHTHEQEVIKTLLPIFSGYKDSQLLASATHSVVKLLS